MNKTLYAFLTLFMAIILSCKKDIAVTSVSLTPLSADIVVGESIQLKAEVLPDKATNKEMSWTSSNLSVAMVSNTGLVTALSEGRSIIVAEVDGKSATCAVTVSKKVIEVRSIELNKTSVEMYEGDTETLSVIISPNDATEKSIIWSSSDSNVATVADGLITAEKKGTAVITASVSDKKATCSVVVKQRELGGGDPEGFNDHQQDW